MKRNVVLVVLLASLLIAYFFFINDYDSKSIAEALDIPDQSSYEVIHIEALDGSQLVLSISDDHYMHSAIVSKRLGRYKTVYSGVSGDIDRVAEIFGVSDHYFPGIKNASDPLLFGMIGNPEISELVLLNTESNEEKKIEIIEKENIRLWVEILENTEAIDYKLIGYSEKGEGIIERDLKFAPREIRSQY